MVSYGHTELLRIKLREKPPFSLVHGVEAMAQAEVNIYSLPQTMMTQNAELNNNMLLENLDTLDEQWDQALLRIQNCHQLVTRYYNKRVKNRHFDEGNLVLRKVYENTAEWKVGKPGENWEGPYQIMKVVKPEVYELMTMEGEPIPRSWNSMSLKGYY